MDLVMMEEDYEKERMGEQFTESATRIDNVLHQMYDRDMESGAVLSGALTTVLHHLIELAPDKASAMGVLSSCLRNASMQNSIKATLFEVADDEDDNDETTVKVH